jgi:heavy metal sensor kinase
VTLPIRVRLTAWYGLLLAATLVALGAFLVIELRSDLRSRIDGEVRTGAGAITENYLADGLSGFRATSAAALRRSGSEAQVLGADGHVVARYGGELARHPMIARRAAALALAGKIQLLDVRLGPSAQPFRVLATPVLAQRQAQLVVVAAPLQGVDEAVTRILRLLLLAGPVAMLIAALGVWWLLRRALDPVERMRRKAELIGIDQLHERLAAPKARDEIGQLAETLNAMLDRLEAGVIAKRQLIADASHELRTPLAAMRVELDVSLRDPRRTADEREVLESVREDVDRMSRTVDNLMTLAYADEGRLELVRDEVELNLALDAAARPLRALAAAKRVQLRIAGEPCRALGDPQRLRQALANLIENAIKFTPPGGEVTLSSWRRAEEVGVTVRDTGPGIPADERSHVFDRFYRVDRSRSRESGGGGLGLAICREIATAHGGRVWVESEEGKGSAFSMALRAYAGADGPDDERISVPAGDRSAAFHAWSDRRSARPGG